MQPDDPRLTPPEAVSPGCSHDSFESVVVEVTRPGDGRRRFRTRTECFACGAHAWSPVLYAEPDPEGPAAEEAAAVLVFTAP